MTRVASKILVAGAVAIAVGSAFAADPGWRGGPGPAAGHGPGSENCAMTGGAAAGNGRMMGGMGRGGHMGGAMMTPATAEARLDGVKSALKITAEQDNAWSAYAAAVKTQADQRAKFREQITAADPAARLALRDQHVAAHAESIKAMDAARNGLYAVLTAEQRTAADRLLGFPGFAWRGHAHAGS